jgi:NAD(P)-dependent dehydrogenase (short-subunit alcohol dehydrogenase family)
MSNKIVITGASKGIGLELARIFLAGGHKVIGTSRTGIIKDIVHENFLPVKLDLADVATVEGAVKSIQAAFVSIDMLINNAGIGPDLEFSLPEEASFNQTFAVNATGTVFFTEAMLPLVQANGKIINVSSKMGSVALCSGADAVAYRMSKSALNMYTKILANRLSGKQLVAALHPGWVRTDITASNVHAPLSAAQSAAAIFEFVTTGFKTGIYWNADTKQPMEW